MLFMAVSQGEDLSSKCSEIETMAEETQKHLGAQSGACKRVTPSHSAHLTHCLDTGDTLDARGCGEGMTLEGLFNRL